jgi:integrating conjugative element protein (TIGR03755 family)
MKKTTLISLIAFMPFTWANTFIPNNSTFNYRIGGASSLYVPAVSNVKKYKLGASINGSLLPTCGNFNPAVTITNSLEDIKNMFSGIKTSMVSNLTYAAQGYALAKLQQSLPGIFDMLKHQSAFAGNEFNVKVKRCESMQKDVAAGGSPFDGLVELSDTQGWTDAARRASQDNVDILNEDKKITQHREEFGLPWLHEDQKYSGGRDQKPIKVIEDVVKAGFNILAYPDIDKPLDSDEVITDPSSTNANFVRFWKKPSDAASWAKTVLGDLTFSKNPTKRGSEAGIGLSAVLQSCPHITENGNTCPSNVSGYLWQLVKGEREASTSQLQQISTANMVVTSEIISTLQSLDREEQIISVSKLSEDIAIQNLVEEALSLRRILIAGYQIQEVQNLKPIREMVKGSIDLLDSEIKSLAFENTIRSQLANKTLKTLTEIREEMLSKSNRDQDSEDDGMVDGAIYITDKKQGAAL